MDHRNKKILLLDFDGVILDSLPIVVGVYNNLLKKYQISKQFTEDEFRNLFLGNFHDGLTKIIKDKKIREKILEEKTKAYIQSKAEFKIFPEIKNVLENLSKQAKLIIISSNHSNFITEILNYHNIEYIDKILGADIEKSKVKKIKSQTEKYPDHKIYYVGDTVGDIREAKLARVKVIGVTWGFHSREILVKENPDFLINKPSELIQII